MRLSFEDDSVPRPSFNFATDAVFPVVSPGFEGAGIVASRLRPPPEVILATIGDVGFRDASGKVTGGILSAYVGIKPD